MARSFTANTDKIALGGSYTWPASFTISCLVFLDSNKDSNLFIGGDGGSGVEFRSNASGNLQLLKQASALLGSSSGTLSVTTWTQVAVSYDGTNVAFYINGAASGTASNANSFLSVQQNIGNAPQFPDEFLTGDIAEFAIWNDILTASEVAILGKFYSPEFVRPSRLTEYVPMVRDNYSRVSATTIANTTVASHPRIIRPHGPRAMKWTTAAAPTGRIFRLAGYGGGLVGPQVGLAG